MGNQTIARSAKFTPAQFIRKYGNISINNRFVVSIDFPEKVREKFRGPTYSGTSTTNTEKIESELLEMLCTDASLPGSTFATSEIKDSYMGVTQEFAHTRLYTDIDFTYYIDTEYRVLRYFEAWMDYISGGADSLLNQNASSNQRYYRRFNYPNTYKSSMRIYKFERYNKKTNTLTYLDYSFTNAFPKSLAATPVNSGDSELLKVTVTMNYDRYRVLSDEVSLPEDSPPPPPGPPAPPLENGNSGRIKQLQILAKRGTISNAQRIELQELTSPKPPSPQ